MTETIDPQPVIYAVTAIGILLMLVAFVWRHRKKPTVANPLPVAAPVLADAPTPCRYCGEPATRPPARTARGVSGMDALRVRFGAPPRYAPAIDGQLAPVLCETHGRMWDARLARQLVVTVETKRAEAEVAIADTMAAFESERLDAEMVAGLTVSQREELQKKREAKG